MSCGLLFFEEPFIDNSQDLVNFFFCLSMIIYIFFLSAPLLLKPMDNIYSNICGNDESV